MSLFPICNLVFNNITLNNIAQSSKPCAKSLTAVSFFVHMLLKYMTMNYTQMCMFLFFPPCTVSFKSLFPTVQQDDNLH